MPSRRSQLASMLVDLEALALDERDAYFAHRAAKDRTARQREAVLDFVESAPGMTVVDEGSGQVVRVKPGRVTASTAEMFPEDEGPDGEWGSRHG